MSTLFRTTSTWEYTWTTSWTGLRTEAVYRKGQSWLFAQVIQCLQYHGEDVLPVCGSQRYFLCCRVLRQQGEGSQHQQNQQAHPEGRLCPDFLVVVSERRMLSKHHDGPSWIMTLTVSTGAPSATDCYHHNAPQEIFSSCGNQTLQLINLMLWDGQPPFQLCSALFV